MRRTSTLALLLAVPALALLALAGARHLAPRAHGQDAAPGLVVEGLAGEGHVAAPANVLEGHFATSLACARCHASAPGAQAMRDSAGRSVAPFDLWRSSMKANAARDPLWRAAVAAEVAATPAARAEIEADCARCHLPMAAEEARRRDLPVNLALLGRDDALGQLARDGVSCTVCHQIDPANLGKPESFAGGWKIGDERKIYGPHADPFPTAMQRFTGFTPTHATHMRSAGLCATCHVQIAATLEPDGTHTGHRLVEQASYLEWRNSDFRDEAPTPGASPASCASCHFPITDASGAMIVTKIARNPGGRDFPGIDPRAPFGRHVLVGGNTLLPAIFRDHGAELGVNAPPEAFGDTLARAREQLQTRTARLALEGVAREGATLLGRVRVENLTGHKVPTGFPLRRLWLRVRVTDGAGRVVFESGGHDDAGRLVGAGGAVRASEQVGGPIEPHRGRVAGPDDVVVWEAIMADPAGRPTFRVRRGARFLKDDRLLPRGWRPDHPDAAATAPVGVAEDPGFGPGGATVALALPVGEAAGPLALEVDVLYQPLAARFAAELLAFDAPEIARFRRYWELADRRPERVARAEARVE